MRNGLIPGLVDLLVNLLWLFRAYHLVNLFSGNSDFYDGFLEKGSGKLCPQPFRLWSPPISVKRCSKYCLISVLDQSVLPSKYEVVVVDNASTPHEPTQELCRSSRYSLLNIKCVHNPVLGLSQARNYGMRNTSAPYVAFIDDDEKIPLHWVERAIEIIDNYFSRFFWRTVSPRPYGGQASMV